MQRSAYNGAGSWSARTWRSASLVAVCFSVITTGAEAQQVPEVIAGRAVIIPLPVPGTDGDRPAVLRIAPAQGMAIEGSSDVLLAGVKQVTVTINVPVTAPPGLFSAAKVTFLYIDGRRTIVDCHVRVLESDVAPRGASSVPAADHVSLEPEALVRIPGTEIPVWIADPTERSREPAHEDAAPVLAATVNARLSEPRNTIKGVAYAGATELALRGTSEAETGFGVDLSGRLGTSTQVRGLYIHGWNPGLSPVFRYGMHRSRGHLRIRAPGWSVEAGEIRTVSPLAGGVVPADGASLQKTRGVLLGSLVAARPKYFAGGWGGHLFQGSVGFGFTNGSVIVFASDLARPLQSSRVSATRPPAENSELVIEDLERVGALLSRENRVRSGGVETRLKFGRHDVMARAGWVDLASPTNERSSGGAASANYSFRSNRTSFSGQFQTGPASPAGMASAGDLLTLGGKVILVGPVALVSRTYWQEVSLLGRSSITSGKGATAGLEYAKDQARFRFEGSYRESSYLSTTTTRSIKAGLRWPMGIGGIDMAVEFGEAKEGPRRRHIASYRGSVYAEGERASVMLSGSYRDYGLSSPRLFVDLSGTIDWRGATLEAGTGISRAGIFGDVFNAYTTLEFPVPGELSILLGADYDRWSYADSPYLIFLMDDDETPPWRFTVNVRRKLSLSMPLVK